MLQELPTLRMLVVNGKQFWSLTPSIDHNKDYSLQMLLTFDWSKPDGNVMTWMYLHTQGDVYELVPDKKLDEMVKAVVDNMNVDSEEAHRQLWEEGRIRTYGFVRAVYGEVVEYVIADLMKRWEAIRLLVNPGVTY